MQYLVECGFECFVADDGHHDALFVELEYHHVLLCRLTFEMGQCQIKLFEPVKGPWTFDLNDFYLALDWARRVFHETHGLEQEVP